MDSDPPGRSGTTRRGFLTVAAGTTAALAGCATGFAGSDGAPETGASQEPDAPAPTGDVRYTETYREVSPSVTTVRVSGGLGLGQGSGAVVDDRHVVTNQHMVDGAEDVSVVYTDGSYTTAEIRGTDVYSDLAVLEVDHPNDPPALRFATRDPPVGREVIVVGTPYGVGESVSAGVVSGVDRSLPGPREFTIPDAIQTDAAANPGNSGGPLVALDGTPLGLVNAAAGNDLTFAISGALMDRVVPALIETGSFEHTYVGVGIRDLTPAIARANDLDSVRGVYVVEVIDDAPAEGVLEGADGRTRELGEQVPTGGDVVRAVDGSGVRDAGTFGSYLALEADPGDTVTLTVLRDGEERDVEVTLGSRPEPN
jgi:S1-C subfamily serine protease